MCYDRHNVKKWTDKDDNACYAGSIVLRPADLVDGFSNLSIRALGGYRSKG